MVWALIVCYSYFALTLLEPNPVAKSTCYSWASHPNQWYRWWWRGWATSYWWGAAPRSPFSQFAPRQGEHRYKGISAVDYWSITLQSLRLKVVLLVWDSNKYAAVSLCKIAKNISISTKIFWWNAASFHWISNYANQAT